MSHRSETKMMKQLEMSIVVQDKNMRSNVYNISKISFHFSDYRFRLINEFKNNQSEDPISQSKFE